MASAAKRLRANAPGDFFVDSTCIDCGACRWVAPESFDACGDTSRVYRQPGTPAEEQAALRALVACPTGSIGTTGRHDMAPVIDSFPLPIAGGVHYCGFHSPDSFGAASYLVVREGGNVLVDSPRWNRRLARRIDALGGADLMFLTHRDDVADHDRWRQHLGCERIIHARDRTAATAAVERVIEGDEPVPLADDLVIIPTPGHTAGSACLLHAHQFLFSGDHVAWSQRMKRVYAFADTCWYDWDLQIESMRRLLPFRFEHILPGHGAPCHFSAPEMRQHMERCVAWMERV